MSHPVITDPVLPSRRRDRNGKAKGSSVLSFPLILIIICSLGGLPPISARLWALNGVVQSHNDAIVSVIMAVAPYFLVILGAVGLLVFIRAGQPVDAESES